MDERLEKALEFSNYMVTLNNQKRLLKERFYENIIHYYNGGQFTVTQNLISFCQSLMSLSQTGTILIDDNENPIEVENLEEFTDNILDIYWTAVNSYHTEYEKLRKNRTVTGLVEHNE